MQESLLKQFDCMRYDISHMNSTVSALKEAVSMLIARTPNSFESCKCNSKSGVRTLLNTKDDEFEYTSTKPKRDLNHINKLDQFSVSSHESSILKNRFKENRRLETYGTQMNEFNLDSSSSAVIQPDGLNFDFSKIGKNSRYCIENQLRNLNIENSDNFGGLEPSVSKDMLESFKGSNMDHTWDVKVKDFDDFKYLLQGLKFSLDTSNISLINGKSHNEFEEAELLVSEYAALDREIYKVSSSQKRRNNHYLSPLTSYRGILNRKKSQSVNLGFQNTEIYISRLNILSKATEIHMLEAKLKELKNSPKEIEAFIRKVKRNLIDRRNQFEELQEFIL